MIALDTESTGLDLYHGCRPYFVTTCDEEGTVSHWRWNVDPLTRKVAVDENDLGDINRSIEEADRIVLQNAKFDAGMLEAVGAFTRFPWEKVEDTMIAGHVLASNQPHNLTDMVMQYLGRDIEPFEKTLRKNVLECRRYCQRHLKEWRIASDNLDEMPSAGKEDWKADGWLPLVLANFIDQPINHPWKTCLEEYANVDSPATFKLWIVLEEQLNRRGLWKIYREKMKQLPILCGMEAKALTVNRTELCKLKGVYEAQSNADSETCIGIASSLGYNLQMPRSANNDSLINFVFGPLNLPAVKRSKKTGAPSLDKEVMETYLNTLEESSLGYQFIRALTNKRKKDTSINYLESYERFGLSIDSVDGWFKLHTNIKPVGTATTRLSSERPNSQNVSSKEDDEKHTLRDCFGPMPGREWWTFDAENIELRIPAYVSGERAMIELFERPNDPPYFGSNHLLACHILHPQLFDASLSCTRCGFEINGQASRRDSKFCSCIKKDSKIIDGRIFKLNHKEKYKRSKNGNFAVQFGAIETSGTADRAYGVPGGQAKIQKRLGKIADLNRSKIAFAERNGYVETMPDKNVCPELGYPLLCTRTANGSILPTVPLSYFVQGTSGWWMLKAMIRCQELLDGWNRLLSKPLYFMILTVHDELVFDFPKLGNPKNDWDGNKKCLKLFRTSNLWRAKLIQAEMAKGGDDIGLPTPVTCEWHPESWAKGVGF